MATIEQNIEQVKIIFDEIGKAINEMYAKAYMSEPYISQEDCPDCEKITSPDELADLIRGIPQDLTLDPSMFSARVEIIE